VSFLNLSNYEPLAPLELVPPATKKSPAAAFLLSLLFPGAGHLYIGLNRNAAWLAGFAFLQFVALICGAIFRAPVLAGVAILGLPVTYIFAFLDAFYSAREWNAGISPFMIGASPRTAALLNLLGSGIGYFYLGERRKGIVIFVAFRLFPYLFPASMHRSMLIILGVLQLAFAFDGWRVGRKLPRQQQPTINRQLIASRNSEGMPALIPIGTACLVATGLVALVVLGATMQAMATTDKTHARFRQIANRQEYSNSAYGLTFSTPADWTLKPTTDVAMLATAEGGDYPCSVQLKRYFRIQPQPLIEWELEYLPDPLEGSKSERGWVAFKGLPAFQLTARTGEGDPVEMHYVAFKKGASTFLWIETRGGSCGPAVDEIAKTLASR
jgi:hypothetical protein